MRHDANPPYSTSGCLAPRGPSRRARPLRSAPRARCLRHRPHRQHPQPQKPQDHFRRPEHPEQSRAPRRRRRRPQGRRRRRRADPDPACVLRRPGGPAGLRAAGAAALRRRLPVHAARAHLPPGHRAHLVGDGARGRPEGSRLARRAGRSVRARSIGAGHRALPPPAVHRPRSDHPRRGAISSASCSSAARWCRTACSRCWATRRAPTTRCRCPARTIIYKGLVLGKELGAYYRDLAGRRRRIGLRAGASALLDQHLPVLAAGPSLSLHLPQWRDQHGARQLQLDGGAPGQHEVGGARRGSREAVADFLRGPVRHRLLRQRARISLHGRLFASPCDDDAHPRGLGGQSAHGSRTAAPSTSIMPPSWSPGTARPPWRSPTAGSSAPRSTATGCGPRATWSRDDGHVLLASEMGCLRFPEEQDQPQVAAAARQDAAHRSRAEAHHLRRGAEEDAGRRRIPTRSG